MSHVMISRSADMVGTYRANRIVFRACDESTPHHPITDPSQTDVGWAGRGHGSRGLPTPSTWRSASRIAATIAGVDEMHGGSPTPFAPSGACGSGISISVLHDVGHVEERRQQVVGEVAVADHAVDLDDLLHHGQPEPLGDAALDLAGDRQRVERPADVLGRRDLHHLHQAELADRRRRPPDGRRTRTPCGSCPGRSRRGPRSAGGGTRPSRRTRARRSPRRPTCRQPDTTSTTSVSSIARRIGSRPCAAADVLEQPLAHRPARGVDRSPAHPRLARRRRRPGGADLGVDPVEHHVVDAEDRPGDLSGDRDESLTDLGRGELERGHAVGEPAAGRRVVVEALGVHQVLDRHAPADAADDVAAVGRSSRAARQAPSTSCRSAGSPASAAPRCRGCTARRARRSRPADR